MSTRWTFKQKFDRAKDFLRFLETEKIDLSGGIKKKKVQKMYNKQYKVYREQVAPNETLIPYHMCMQTLYNNDIIHSKGSDMCKGPRASPSPEREVKAETPTQQKQGKEAESSEKKSVAEDSATASTHKPVRRRRRSRGRNRKSASGAKPNGQLAEQEVEQDPKKVAMAARLQRLRFKRQWPVKVAVDQHLTFHRTEPQPDDSDVKEEEASSNVADTKYIKKVEDENLFACRVCHTTCTSEADVERHLNGKVHRLAVVMHRLKSMRYEKNLDWIFLFLLTNICNFFSHLV